MRVIAHRGMNRQAPENTIPAFEYALEQAEGIELDVQLTGCGTAVVSHDDTLGRVFGVPHAIASMTVEELQKVRPADAPEIYVPTLEEVLELIPVDYFLNIEIKAPRLAVTTPTDAVVKVLKAQPDRNVVISSFNPLELYRAHTANVGYRLGLLFGHDATNMFMKHGLSAQVFGSHLGAIHPNWKIVSPWLIEEAATRDWDVNVWTVNDVDRANWLAHEGVDSVISDVADVLIAERREVSAHGDI